ncbi:MAG: energy transducer TonB [Ignavibacteriaceae bacterium]
MKKIFMLILIMIFLPSCNETRKREIIDTTEKDSFMASDSLTPALNGGFKYKSSEWENVDSLLKMHAVNEPDIFENTGFTFKSLIYFSAEGNIEKIIKLESINNQVDNAILRFIQKTFKIIPPEINNKRVRLHTYFTINYNTDGLNFLPETDNSLIPKEAPEDLYHVTVDEMPSPVGGMIEIVKRIKYPEEAKEQGIEGKVIIKLFIDESGNPQSCKIIKGVNPLLDAEAEKVLMKTKFNPGKIDGKPVKVQVAIPIVFKLK